MNVVITAYRVRPGEADALVALHESWERTHPHILSAQLLRACDDPAVFLRIVRYTGTAVIEADDPDLRVWLDRLASLAEGTPTVGRYRLEWALADPAPEHGKDTYDLIEPPNPRKNTQDTSMTTEERTIMGTNDNGQLTITAYDNFSNGRYDDVLTTVADDVRVELIPTGQVFEGKEGFRAFMLGFKTAFPDCRIEVLNQITAGDTVVNEIMVRGTHTGPLATPAGELPPTGRSAQWRVCEVWEIRGGRIAALRNYQDLVTVLSQLGLLPEPAPAG